MNARSVPEETQENREFLAEEQPEVSKSSQLQEKCCTGATHSEIGGISSVKAQFASRPGAMRLIAINLQHGNIFLWRMIPKLSTIQ